MSKRITKKQRALQEFKIWLRKAIMLRIEDGTLKEADINSYARGAHKVWKKVSI